MIKGQTPLFYAAREGHLEMCKMLVEKGANISHSDSDNKTAVQYARKFNKTEVLEYLTNQITKLKDTSRKAVAVAVTKDDSKKHRKKDVVLPRVITRLTYTDDQGNTR